MKRAKRDKEQKQKSLKDLVIQKWLDKDNNRCRRQRDSKEMSNKDFNKCVRHPEAKRVFEEQEEAKEDAEKGSKASHG